MLRLASPPPPKIGLGAPEDVASAVLLDLLEKVASKPCFHALRTQQRLGYTAGGAWSVLGWGHWLIFSLAHCLTICPLALSPASVCVTLTPASSRWNRGLPGTLAALMASPIVSTHSSTPPLQAA